MPSQTDKCLPTFVCFKEVELRCRRFVWQLKGDTGGENLSQEKTNGKKQQQQTH